MTAFNSQEYSAFGKGQTETQIIKIHENQSSDNQSVKLRLKNGQYLRHDLHNQVANRFSDFRQINVQ